MTTNRSLRGRPRFALGARVPFPARLAPAVQLALPARLALAARRAVAAQLALIVLLAAGGSRPALASCVAPPDVEQAVRTSDIVFVGTVSATSNGNRWAEVVVQEVWRGADMPATVVVQGGPAGNTMTSVDRSFQVGTTYLFFPYVDPSSTALADNNCSSTTEWTEDLARLRPADVRQPLGGEPTAPAGLDVEALLPLGLAVVVFGALLVVGLLARGRQEA